MLEEIKSIGKSTAIYSLGNISSKIVGFILLPVLTNETYLSVEAYGLLGLFEAILQLFVILFGLGIYNGLFRWYFEDEKKQKSLIFTALLFVISTATAGFFIGIYFEDFLTQFLFEDDSFLVAYRWMVFTAALQLISVIPVTLMRLKEDAKLFSTTAIVRLSVTLLLTLLFLIPLNLKLNGVFAAQASGHAIFLIMVFPYLVRNTVLSLDIRVPTVLLKYSLPIMFSALMGILIQFIDRFILNSIQGLSEVGIYSLAIKIANVIKVFVITTMSLSLTPILFKKINVPDHKRFYSKTMTYYGYGILLVIMGVSLFSYEVIKVFSGSVTYWESFTVIPLLSMSLYFVAIKTVGVMALHITKKMWPLTAITTIVLGLNIVLNLYLIPVYGIIGAGLATLISDAVYFSIIYRVSQYYYKIPFEWKKVVAMPVLAFFLIYLGIETNNWNVWVRIPIKFVVIALFPVILYFWGFYEEIEKKRLKLLYNKWKSPKELLNNLKNL